MMSHNPPLRAFGWTVPFCMSILSDATVTRPAIPAYSD